MSLALIPVKDLWAGKSRLGSRLSRAALSDLCLAMLEDLLEALAGVPSLERTAVVTPDARVAATARRAGAKALLRSDSGLNADIESAAQVLCTGPAESLLVVLGDVAGAYSGEIEQLFEALSSLGGRGAVLSPSDDGGTAALLRSPHDVIPARFGADSAKQHREAAAREGVPYRELHLPSMAIDLDRAEDIDRFLGIPGGGRRTRTLLQTLGWSAAG